MIQTSFNNVGQLWQRRPPIRNDKEGRRTPLKYVIEIGMMDGQPHDRMDAGSSNVAVSRADEER